MARKKGFLDMVRDHGPDEDTEELKKSVQKLKTDDSPDQPNDFDQPTDNLTDNLTDSSTDRQTDDSTGKPTDSSTVRQTIRQVNRQIDRQFNRQFDQQFDRQTTQQVNQQTTQQTIRQVNRQTVRLTKNQKIIYDYIATHGSVEATLEELAYATDVKYGSVREVVRNLVKQNLITSTLIGAGQKKTKIYTINQQINQQAVRQINQQITQQTDQQITRQTDNSTDRPIDREIERFYLSREGLKRNFPNLVSIGWTVKQSRQVVERFEAMGWDHSELKDCFKVAEILAGDQEFLEGLHKTPLNFFFGSIHNNTIYFPEGYKTPQQKAAEKRKKQLEQLEEEEFQVWKANLSEEEYQDLIKDKKGPEEKWLRYRWKQQRSE